MAGKWVADGGARMKSVFFNKWLILSVRLILGAIFVYAGFVKLSNPADFADSIGSFQILPISLINILALGLPPVEILAGVMMISGWRYRPATLCILLLATVFALALIQALIRGLQVDCGCFGSGKPSEFKTWLSLGRDLLILIGSLFVYASSLRLAVGKSLPSGEKESTT